MDIKRLAAGAAIALAVASAAGYGASIYAQREAQKQVDESFARLPAGAQAHHGAVSYSIFGDRLSIADVSLDLPDQWLRSLSAERVEVSGINHGFLKAMLSRSWGRGDDEWRAGAIAASKVAYDLAGGVHESIDRFAVTDPRLGFAGAPPIEQWGRAQWLAAISWSSGETEKLTASVDALPDGATLVASLASSSLGALEEGRLASIVERDLAWDATGQPLGKLHLEIGELRGSDLDVGSWEKLFDPARYGEAPRDPTLYSLFGSIAASKLALSVEGESPFAVSLDALSLAGLKMRQLPFRPDTPPADLTPAQSLELAQSMSLDSLAIDKLALTLPQHPDTAVALDHVALKLTDKNHAELDNLSVKTAEADVTLGTLAVDGLAVRLPEKLLSALAEPGAAADKSDAPPEAATPAPEESAPAPRPGFFVEHYQLADVVVRHKAVGEISLKDLTATMTGSIDNPTGAALDMQNLTVDLEAIGHNPGAEMVGALGYGQVSFEAHAKGAYDTDAKRVDSELSFGAPDMGTLHLAYRLDNYTFGGDPSDEAALIEGLMKVAISDAELRYDDASLADRVIDVLATQASQPSAAMRQSFVTMLEQQKSAHGAEPLVVNALDAAIDFLVKPRSIRIAAKPEHPVTLAQLSHLGDSEPNEIMTLLGVTVDRPQ